MESKAAVELSRFAKPMVPSGMRFEHAALLKCRVRLATHQSLHWGPAGWFRVRVA